MNRANGKAIGQADAVPRTSGDEPLNITLPRRVIDRSPHERG